MQANNRYEGVVGIVRTKNGFLLLPSGKENGGKREKHIAQSDFVPVVGLENMGGKVEYGETLKDALKNEVWQEGRIPLFDSQIECADFGVIVEQEKRGTFDVSVYYLNLFWWQKLVLKVLKGAREVDSKSLSRDTIRGRDLEIIKLTEGNL